MTHAQARKIAIEAIRQQIKSITIDANMHDRLGATYPHAINASKRRRELLEAIDTLKRPEQVSML